jgi:hypothetical protein
MLQYFAHLLVKRVANLCLVCVNLFSVSISREEGNFYVPGFVVAVLQAVRYLKCGNVKVLT